MFGLVFVSHDFEVGRNVSCKSQPSVPYGVNLFVLFTGCKKTHHWE